MNALGVPGLTQQNVQMSLAAGAGIIGAAFVKPMIPIANPLGRTLALAVVGLIVIGTASGAVRMVGVGISAVAAADVIRQFLPVAA